MEGAGRPSLFKTVEEIERKIEEYYFFIEGEFEIMDYVNLLGEPDKKKVYTREAENPSITGLALYLGFESRQSIYDYEKSGEFSYTIKRARLKIESAYEQALLTRNSTGAIFALKNFGWTDKQEVVNTNFNHDEEINYDELSDAALEEIAKAKIKR